MKKFIYVFLTVGVLFDMFVNYSRQAGLIFEMLPEALSGFILLLAAYEIANKRYLEIPSKYLVLFTMFFVFIVFSWFANQVQPGAVLGGVRNMFRYMPYFLVPFLYRIQDKDITKILRWLLVLCAFQIPVVLYQRFLERGLVTSGDHVVGTFALSSLLSVFLMMAIAVAMGLFIQKRLKAWQLVVVLALLFFPTTINETKGTFFMLPLAFLVPSLVYAVKAGKLKQMIPVFVLFFSLFFGFITMYDASIGSSKEERDLVGFLTNPDKLKRYFIKEDEIASYDRFGYSAEVGRVDAMIHAHRHISKDISTAFFGLGVGNVSNGIAGLTVGEFTKYEQYIPQYTTISIFMWETGYTGLVFLAIGWFFFWQQAKYLSDKPGVVGALALGWAGALMVYFMALSYKNIMNSGGISVVYWFINGLLAQRAMEFRKLARQENKSKSQDEDFL